MTVTYKIRGESFVNVGEFVTTSRKNYIVVLFEYKLERRGLPAELMATFIYTSFRTVVP